MLNPLRSAHLRVARPTDALAPLVAFYRDGLGFEVLASFTDHDGFDGVMLGHPAAAYHLEFTRRAGHPAGSVPSAEHLLVFYLPDAAEWRAAVERLEAAGHRAVPAENPYWDRHGRTFADPDGYRVVLQNAAWGGVVQHRRLGMNPHGEPGTGWYQAQVAGEADCDECGVVRRRWCKLNCCGRVLCNDCIDGWTTAAERSGACRYCQRPPGKTP